MAEITQRLPYAISERAASLAQHLTSTEGRAIDYAINGIPFLSAASNENPFQIETAQMEREQQDQELEPGEQTLDGWWIRSQESWHEGAGAKFQEPRGQIVASSRFLDSKNIDVWTPGELKLARRMVQATTGSTSATCLHHSGPGNLFLGLGADIGRTTVTGSGGAPTIIHTQSTETITDITGTRDHAYAITEEGSVVMVRANGASSTVWSLNFDGALNAPPQIGWAKHRLFVTMGRSFFVMTTEEDTGTPIEPQYSHPIDDWAYTDIADGPSSVYLAGNSWTESAVQRVTLVDAEGVLEVSPGVTTAVLPRGETIQRIAILGGTWMGIGTSKGFRLGAIDAQGDVQYGPVFIEPEQVVECTAMFAHDRFFFVAFRTEDARAVVYRVDTSEVFDDGTAAWAPDVEIDDNGCFVDLYVTQLNATPPHRVVAAFEGGLFGAQAPAEYWYEHESELVDEGWIQMSQIRYRTTEPKIFRWIGVDMKPLAGTLTIDTILNNESTDRVVTYTEQGTAEVEQVSLKSLYGPQRSMGFKFTLNPSTTDATQGPILNSYQVKSLPAVKPQRIIQLPLMCWDWEMWHTGQRDGFDGWAKERLDALYSLEDSGDLIIWQDFAHDIVVGNSVKIEAIAFRQLAPPNPIENQRGYGGIVTLVLRTLD